MSGARIAVVLCNLGGPDRREAVRPFLVNLFSDPAILSLPGILRVPLARLIAARRGAKARGIYEAMGGGSPILPNTLAQAAALQAALADLGSLRCFVAMRYWHPLVAETVRAVKAFAPDRILLLPLYPQFSTTTTASSHAAWRRAAKAAGLAAPAQLVCCYPTEPGFVAALAELAAAARLAARRQAGGAAPHVIFSAHGLPERVVARGDPYVAQVEATAAAVAARLGLAADEFTIAYQSRVGPLAWVKPATEAVVRAQAAAGKALALVPVAFVSEHAETLVELDINYRRLALTAGAPAYVRAPAVSIHPAFIAGLAGLVRHALACRDAIVPGCGENACAGHGRCALTREAA